MNYLTLIKWIGFLHTLNDVLKHLVDILVAKPYIYQDAIFKHYIVGNIVFGQELKNTSDIINSLKGNVLYQYTTIGDGKTKLDCTSNDVVTSNNIYIYSYPDKEVKHSICQYNEERESDFITMAKAIDLDFYYVMFFGYNRVHFEHFGEYQDFSVAKIHNDISSKYIPIGSTLIMINPKMDKSLGSYNDDTFLKSFASGIINPYLKFIYYIVSTPGHHVFNIISDFGAKIFVTDSLEINGCSKSEIVQWHQDQIEKFVKFYSDINVAVFHSYKEKEFDQYIIENIKGDYKQWYETHIQVDFDRYQELMMFYFIKQNAIDKTVSIINQGTNINAKLPDGTTPLYLSTSLNNANILTFLVAQKAYVDEAKIGGITALMYASLNNMVRAAEILLNHKADVNKQDDKGNTPLILACLKNNEKVVEMLLKYTPDLDIVNAMGYSAIDIAKKNCTDSVVELLEAMVVKDILELDYPI